MSFLVRARCMAGVSNHSMSAMTFFALPPSVMVWATLRPLVVASCRGSGWSPDEDGWLDPGVGCLAEQERTLSADMEHSD